MKPMGAFRQDNDGDGDNDSIFDTIEGLQPSNKSNGGGKDDNFSKEITSIADRLLKKVNKRSSTDSKEPSEIAKEELDKINILIFNELMSRLSEQSNDNENEREL